MTSTATKWISLLVLLLLIVLLLHRPPADPTSALDYILDELDLSAFTGVANTFNASPTCTREWTLPPSQDWPVLRSKDGCGELYGETPSLEVCRFIAGKRLLFVGPDTTYHLHSVWLQRLESHENRSHHCLGRDYCTFHHICRPSASAVDDLEVFIGRKKKFPSRNTLREQRSSVLQYALSTTLYASYNEEDDAYMVPTVDVETGIRIENSFWLRQARKADIIVLNRGPLPAPASTYLAAGWAFALELCASVNYLHPTPCNVNLEHTLVNAALHATINSFFPALLRTLRVISNDLEISKSLILWHGTWFIQPLCAVLGLPKRFPLVRNLYSNSKPPNSIDAWSLYYNSQGMGQTSVAK
ncbi:hypothetical protein JR316_0002056 [Psilocybe cubensis]|uniref:Uncharacterized protein n=2 Tax=Psilocybe cubensis TaxID=181762 RepID=A0ACB8HD77_PSICU|nr:hypothetical protein JR316_0002056 [Psilocybe cubensis]KAH9485149.1 hypothetical protein JR316_0002056 [Psilocybe cubensis]